MGNRAFTQVPPDSTGDKLAMRTRTKGADNVLEQSVYLSEEETHVALADAVAFVQNKHHISLLNAAASGVTVRIHQIRYVNLSLTAVTGVGVRFDIKKITAHSGGTPLTPEKFDANNAALPAGVTARTGATSVTEGAILMPIALNNDEIPLTLLNANAQNNNIFFNELKSQPFVLREGEGVTVKQITNTTVGSFAWLIVFSVESKNEDV